MRHLVFLKVETFRLVHATKLRTRSCVLLEASLKTRLAESLLQLLECNVPTIGSQHLRNPIRLPLAGQWGCTEIIDVHTLLLLFYCFLSRNLFLILHTVHPLVENGENPISRLFSALSFFLLFFRVICGLALGGRLRIHRQYVGINTFHFSPIDKLLQSTFQPWLPFFDSYAAC